MEEVEKSLESEEARLKNGFDPPDSAVIKVCSEIKNGNGNMREEVENYENENDSPEEFKAVVNLKEGKDSEERNGVKQIENGEEDKNMEETKVVIEEEPMKAVDGKEKEDVNSNDREGNKNFEKNEDEGKKKEVEVQNVNEVEIGLKGNDGEANSLLERVEVARDEKSVEAVGGVECNSDKNGLGDDEAVGRKSEEEDRNPISDKPVNELENDEVEGVEEMKDVQHGKSRNGDKDEESVLVQVEANHGGKAGKEANDMEMCGAEEVVEKEAADVKNEVKLDVREGEEVKKDNGRNADKTVDDNQNVESLKRKRGRAQGPSEANEANENAEEMEVEGSIKNSKDVLSSPVVSSSDRPVRERKTVERWVAVIEKAPDRTVIIEKGRGTPLIKIPNVANNLARKKPAELKILHQTLFGRNGKAVDFKSNLLQFSGFTWHESEEKERAKAKEKLDKCVKETLLELCELFDITVSKTNTKKDEIIVKLLDFMEAPHAKGDVMHAEKQASKSRMRERAPEVDALKGSGGNFEKKSRHKHDKTEATPNSDVKSSHDAEDDDEVEDLEQDEDEDSEEQSKKEDEVPSHSNIDVEEKELEETGDEEEEDDESEGDADLRKRKKVKKTPKGKENKDVKSSSDTVKRKNGSKSKKNSPKTDEKSSLKTLPSKYSKAERSNDAGEKALSSKKKDAESPMKSNSKPNSKEKSSGKASKSMKKSGKVQKSGPSKAELLKSISEILKKVDFNTATFTDIIELLASEYKVDLTPRKAAIKLLIQDELNKLVDEEEESQDEEEMQ